MLKLEKHVLCIYFNDFYMSETKVFDVEFDFQKQKWSKYSCLPKMYFFIDFVAWKSFFKIPWFKLSKTYLSLISSLPHGDTQKVDSSLSWMSQCWN